MNKLGGPRGLAQYQFTSASSFLKPYDTIGKQVVAKTLEERFSATASWSKAAATAAVQVGFVGHSWKAAAAMVEWGKGTGRQTGQEDGCGCGGGGLEADAD